MKVHWYIQYLWVFVIKANGMSDQLIFCEFSVIITILLLYIYQYLNQDLHTNCCILKSLGALSKQAISGNASFCPRAKIGTLEWQMKNKFLWLGWAEAHELHLPWWHPSHCEESLRMAIITEVTIDCIENIQWLKTGRRTRKERVVYHQTLHLYCPSKRLCQLGKLPLGGGM